MGFRDLMDIFDLRNRLITDYSAYTQSFIKIQDERIRDHVQDKLQQGLLWPESLIQLNPNFEPGAWIDELVDTGVLSAECRNIFRIKSEEDRQGKPLRLHRHQEDAIRTARAGHNYVLTTGTGSGKSLSYIIPIVDSVLRRGSGKGVQAIIVYPMNALANSQLGELEKFINLGYPDQKGPVRFKRYTGQEKEEDREEIVANPPDIILTNYVMLEYILTRPRERETLVKAAQGLRFLVLDELHTYRGRQGSDVALLVRRVRDALHAEHLQCIGTSATLSSTGSFADQQREVAEVATKLFGQTVEPGSIIGETLRRATAEFDETSPALIDQLRQDVQESEGRAWETFEEFTRHPLPVWIESSFGISRDASGRLTRNIPKTITTGAEALSELTGLPLGQCAAAIKQALMAGFEIKHAETGFPVFAFRLHQFISRGDKVFGSLENTRDRYITVHGQQYVPNRSGALLMPMAFCRQCGQEYYVVSKSKTEEGFQYGARELHDRLAEEGGEPGFIYLSEEEPWPDDPADVSSRVPEDWLEEHRGLLRVKRNRRDNLPVVTRINPEGLEDETGVTCAFIPAPFRFCISCGVAYGFRQTSDYAKLAQLGSEGRSTATTILSLSTILGLNSVEGLKEKARKLLSFTDNRQDASLQAGHFNDFIEVGLIRAAIYKAVVEAGSAGLEHDALGDKVFAALALPKEFYALDPEVRFRAEIETNRAFRDVVSYRLYRDLRRGWRIIAPNLEQCGLLEIRYHSLQEACQAEDLWESCHPCLSQASPENRERVAKILLDYLRRELAIKVDFLEPYYQDRLKQRSNQHLRLPWAIDENERMEHAAVVYPRPGERDDYQGHIYLSGRGGFGLYLGRKGTFKDWSDTISLDDRQKIIEDLLEALRKAGLVEAVDTRGDVHGYQVPAAAMQWIAGDGTRAFHDPISVPNEPEGGGVTNAFFIDFYRNIALGTKGLVAHEHTAQVPYEERVEREETFRENPKKLPILYCSPTMELGIDIAELNVVNMRNVPPTPANYAQRSGRAGRSGQPALVFTYCTTGSSHDQYFFKRQERMVAGAVSPPRLDLGNEDLVKAHVQAIWLAESGLNLGSSLREVLNIEGSSPNLALLENVQDAVNSKGAIERAQVRARNILTTIGDDLGASDWYSDAWVDDVLKKIPLSFEQACERWRSLYRAALLQFETQNRVISDASRPQVEKNRARRLRNEADNQLQLLTESKNLMQSDFYSYRYFASEGFLPGYNFPRLPLSAFIPGRRSQDEFISRPRFLAISEFGPRAIVYHEGSRYIINRVIMPPREDSGAVTHQAKRCSSCGYIHPIVEGEGPDLCEYCRAPLDLPMTSLFRLQNVATRRRDRINSDEEERQRLGYEVISGVRFADHGEGPVYRMATVESGDTRVAKLTYGQAATLWRINLGWRRRKNQNLFGFLLDTERGYWQRNEMMSEDEDPEDPMTQMQQRVVPYVEDRRNCLLLEPDLGAEDKQTAKKIMASLQAALKNAIQVTYQLEESELAAEALPGADDRRSILFYEAAEGGAGVLRRLAENPAALREVAREALSLCHFNPDSGEDERRAPGMAEDCEAACYNCMMSYSNQGDHTLLDRQLVKAWLEQLRDGSVTASPSARTREEHLDRLLHQCESGLEKHWLQYLNDRSLRLPSHAQRLLEDCQTRPDFIYNEAHAVIYVDGPPHDYPSRQLRDQQQTECLEDTGYEVIRFHHEDDWMTIVANHPHVFGVVQ